MFSCSRTVDEDDIRELIGRMTAAQRHDFHVTPAHIRIVLAALRFMLEPKAWLAKPKADPHDDALRRKSEPYAGPAATIADLRRSGLVVVTIICDGPNCWNERRIAFDELGLSEATLVPDIPRWRGFRCQRCGVGVFGCRRTGRITGRAGMGVAALEEKVRAPGENC